MDRQGKLNLKDELADKFNKSNAVILAEYRGMTVGEVTDLRVKLREIGAEFKVVKIVLLAIELDVNELSDVVEGFKAQSVSSVLTIRLKHKACMSSIKIIRTLM